MDLLSPNFGLIFWQAITFLVVLFILAKFAWKPIMSSLKEREYSIEQAILAADLAKKEVADLKASNEQLLEEARKERDVILNEAIQTAKSIKEEAKVEASKISAKMVEDAKAVINTEKNAALADVKNQVASISLEIAEKLLRKNLSNDKAQKELVADFVKELKLN
jgi:F-type H+-transporting ATPase subunit b